MKPSLLPLLRSPIDSSELTLEDAALVDGSGNRFPIDDGVPLFAERAGSDETFAFKWQKIGGSYGHEGETRRQRRQWYLDRFGFGTKDELLRFLEGKVVLDAGCGSGVDSAMFAESGATVVAVDLSREAAKATHGRLRELPNVHVLQADINSLPFAPGTFDYISSDQVLHHTPSTEQAFAALVPLLRPAGRIAIYVYRRKSPMREFADDYIRSHATAMPPEECYELCRRITLLGRALSDLHVEVDVPEAIPYLGIERGREDVQRFLYWNVLKCFWNEDYDFETNVIVNFDWYHPRYAFRHEPDEVRQWYAERGLEVERLDVVPSGISAVGLRAST